MARKYDVSRVQIDVKGDGSRALDSKKSKETFFEFYKLFEKYLSKYASNTKSTATSQFDVCGYNSQGILDGNNINFNRKISLSTINKVISGIDEPFAIKKIEYYCDSKLTVVVITKLN